MKKEDGTGRNVVSPVMNREKIVSLLIVALAGLFYIFAPHEIHVATQTDFGLSHGVHIVLGIILVGVAIYYARMKPVQEKIEKKTRKTRSRYRSRRKTRRRSRRSRRRRRR